MHKKLLTISLLVSGREDTTKKCLDSLSSLRRQADSELILVDTGCGEKLRQMIEQYADQIIDFEWCDDFAKARNAGLEKASGEWFLYLDDDEWFEDTSPILDFLKSDEAKEYDQAVYKQRNYLDMQGTAYTDDLVSRLTRIEPDTHFVGKVHEYMSPARGKCKRLDAYVHHYGYVFEDKEGLERHFNRNEILLKQMLVEEPGNVKWRVQLVQEYYIVGRLKELRRTGEEALQFILHEDHPYINQCRGTFYNVVLYSDFSEGKYEQAIERIEEYLTDGRNNAMCQCSLYDYGRKCAMKLEDYPAAERYSAGYIECYVYMQEHPIKIEQEKIISDSILFVKNAVSQDKYYENLLDWAISVIRQDKCREADEVKVAEITEYIWELLDKNGDFFRMPSQIWEIGGRNGMVDLEEMLLGLKFSQWMAAVSSVVSSTKPAELDLIKKHLENIKTKEDIRYDYYKMYYADLMVLVKNDAEAGYISVRNHFYDFSRGMLDFYRQIYNPDAFEGEMEMLPDHCRAAVWIERMLNCGEQNWEEMLHCLKECARSYPELGDQVKHLADLIGREQKHVAEEAQKAADELQSMVLQVKPKVIMLLEEGMIAEAWQVVQQLQQLLPENAEVKQMEVLVRSKFM